MATFLRSVPIYVNGPHQRGAGDTLYAVIPHLFIGLPWVDAGPPNGDADGGTGIGPDVVVVDPAVPRRVRPRPHRRAGGRVIRLIAKLGVLTLAGLGSLAWLAVRIGELGGPGGLFRDTYTVTAEFRDATGVLKGDEVRLARACPSARSAGVERREGRGRRQLRTSTTATPCPTARGSSCTGAACWASATSTPSRPADATAGGARPGRRRPGRHRPHTADAADLSAFLNSTEPLLSPASTPARCNRVMTTMAAALQGREQQIGTAIDDSAAVLTTLQSRATAIGDTMTNLATLLEGMAAEDESVRRLLDGLATTAGAVAADTASLGDAVGETGELAALLDELFATNASQLDASLTQLADIAAVLAAREHEIEEGVRTLPWPSAALIRATNHGSWLQIYGRGFGVVNTWTPEPRIGPDYSDVGPDDTESPGPLLGQPTVPLPALPSIDLGPIQINPPPPGTDGDDQSLAVLLGLVAGPP